MKKLNEMENNNNYNTGAQTTADTNTQTTYNTASYTAPGTSYYTQNPQQYVQQPVIYTMPQQTGKERSKFAKVLLGICGVAAAVTFLFGCAAVWIVGLRAINKPAQTQNSGGQNGYSFNGGSGNDDNDSGFPDDDFFSQLPGFGFDNNDSYGANSNSSKKAGLGVTVTELQLDFTVEDKYDAGCVLVAIEDNSAFIGTQAKVNDLIVEFNGVKTPTLDALTDELDKRQPGDTVTVTLARYEKGIATTFTCEVTLIEMIR